MDQQPDATIYYELEGWLEAPRRLQASKVCSRALLHTSSANGAWLRPSVPFFAS